MEPGSISGILLGVSGRLPRLIVCAALGLLTTLLVTWTLAVTTVVTVQGADAIAVEGAIRPGDPNDQWQWWCTVKSRPGLTVVVHEPAAELPVLAGFTNPGAGQPPRRATHLYRVPPRRRMSQRGAHPWNVSFLDDRVVPEWADPSGQQPRQGLIHATSARGWPMRAFWYEAEIVGASRVDQGGVPVPAPLHGIGPGRVLPCRPLAAGLAADTVFYGGLWYGVLFVPGLIMGAVRRQRGCCPRCAYDLRAVTHDRCPECGWGV